MTTKPEMKPCPAAPTGKISRETRKPKRKWQRKAGGLTIHPHAAHNALAFDASGAGRENLIKSRRNSANSGRFFCACCFTMAAGAGQVSAWPVYLEPVSHPRISRHHTAVRSGRVGSIQHSRSQIMTPPTQATPKIRPNSKAKLPITSADGMRPWADKPTERLLRGE